MVNFKIHTLSLPKFSDMSNWKILLFSTAVMMGTSQKVAAQTQDPSQYPSMNGGMQAASQGGSATAGEFSPVLDSEKRPMTAGGFVKVGPIVYQDITKQAGLSGWKHQMGTAQKDYIIEELGSGVALLDYDNDGWLDIYLVNGSTYDAMSGKTTLPHAALFHNNHDGTFTDVTAKAGVANDRWGFGVAIGDYDNDGWPDIYVSNMGGNRLYHNNHDGTFTDVAEKAGVTLGNWSTGASFGDYDGDGRLDLFVPGYVHYDFDHPPHPGKSGSNLKFCEFRGEAVSCGPRGLPGEPDHLFHNNGDGTFTDVSVKAGVSDPHHFYGFSSTFVDVNDDGKVDLLVTNDSSANFLYLNNGDGTFEDASYYSGFALSRDGRETASMGLAVGDYMNTGKVGLYTTTFSDDYNTLYENMGNANFNETTSRSGIDEITYPFLGWGTEFIDYDNDGWKDIFVVSGHIFPKVQNFNWGTSYAERPLLFHNIEHGKRFETVPAVEGTGLADVIPARGAAFGDIFNDGKIDVIVNCIDHAPVLLRNVNADTHHWVELQMIGGPKSPRDAVGSTVYLTADGMRQRSDVMSGGSYQSSNDQRVHFGLGTSTSVQDVEIHWPDGVREHVKLPSVDRIFMVEEGKGVIPSIYDSIAKARSKQSMHTPRIAVVAQRKNSNVAARMHKATPLAQ